MALTGLLVGLVFGFVLQRGRFCVTGAYRDLWTTRNPRWFVAYLIVIAVQAVGFFGLQAAGVIELGQKPLPLLAVVVGGFIFGFGIVLAGGCATGTYYRAGEGLVGSWFALIFYALFANVMKAGALSGPNTWLRSQTVNQSTIYRSLHLSPWILVLALAAVTVWAVRHQLRKPVAKRATCRRGAPDSAHLLLEKPWHPFITGTLIGLIGVVAWPLSAASGRNDGLGITTPSSNLVVFLTTGKVEAVDWGVWLVIGILVGSFIAAKASGEFRVRVPDATTVVKPIAGGIAMEIGAALAGGCTVGNGMVQTAQFTWQGWVSLVAMLLGTGAAARIFLMRRRQPAVSASTTGASALVGTK